MMRYAAIIENNKVKRVIDVALHKPVGPVSMVNVERYDVQVGDEHIGGKFLRGGVEVKRNPTGAELQAEIEALRSQLTANQAGIVELKAEREPIKAEEPVEETRE